MYTADMEVEFVDDINNASVTPHSDFFAPVAKLATRKNRGLRISQVPAYQAMMHVRWANGLALSQVWKNNGVSGDKDREHPIVPTADEADAKFALEHARSGALKWPALEKAIREVDTLEAANEAHQRALAFLSRLDESSDDSSLRELNALEAANEERWRSLSPLSASNVSSDDFLAGREVLEAGKEAHSSSLTPMLPSEKAAKDSLAELEALDAANERRWKALSPLSSSEMSENVVTAEEELEKEAEAEGGAEYNPGGFERVTAWLRSQFEEATHERDSDDDNEHALPQVGVIIAPPTRIARTWI